MVVEGHLVLMLLSGLIDAVCSYCSNGDQLSITRCAQPLYDVGAFKSDSASQTFSWDLFTHTAEVSYFREVCNAYIRFDLCTSPYREQCFDEEPIKSQYQTAASVLDYLCHEGYRDMLQNFQCIVATLRDESVIECQNRMQANVKMQEIFGGVEESEKEDQICSVMQDYLRCMRAPIVKGCGVRAWGVVRDVVQRPSTVMIPACRVSNANVQRASFIYVLLAVCVTFIALSN